MFAVVNVHKPLGMTSHDVVARLRRVYKLKKVGHLGTLDPLAEGVLPVCLGQATRLIEYFPTDKRYLADVTLGKTTSTLDREGEVLETRPCPPLSDALIQECLKAFIGTIDQKVPLHSAVHVGGKKLYEYAQQGKTVETPTRPVTIHSIDLLEIVAPDSEHPVLRLDVSCGSGTYIRALARDIGEALGCGAFLSALVRTGHGKFTLAAATPLSVLEESGTPEAFLENPVSYLSMPRVSLASEDDSERLAHGMKIDLDAIPQKLKGNQLCLVEFQEEPHSVAQVDGKQLKPLKVFKST